MVRSQAFQLTAEEARVAPDVVTGMISYPYAFILCRCDFDIYHVPCLGSFHVNGIPVQVLFDSGATRSFVSLTLSKKFPESSGMLDCPLEVEIADDRSVRASEATKIVF